MMTINDLFQLSANNEIRKLEIQIKYLETLQHNNLIFIENYLQQEKRQLLEEYNISPNFIAHDPVDEQSAILIAINDYDSISIEAKATLSQYLIVACYSFFEKSIKRIFKLTDRVNDRTLEHIYTIENLRIELRKFHIDFDLLSDSKNLNELRLLNNLIKHSGIVNKELALLNSCWIIDSTIGDITLAFNKLKHCPINLLKNIIQQIQLH